MFTVRSTSEGNGETRANIQYTEDTPHGGEFREGIPQDIEYTQAQQMNTECTQPERENAAYGHGEGATIRLRAYTQTEGVKTEYTQAEGVNMAYTPAEPGSMIYSRPDCDNIMYTPIERLESGIHGNDPESHARTSMHSDAVERSYVSLLADIATIGQPESDAARNAMVVQTVPATHAARDPTTLAYTDQQIVGVAQDTDSLQYDGLQLRHTSHMPNSLGQYENLAYMAEQSAMQGEPSTSGSGDSGNIIIIQQARTGNQRSANIQDMTAADGIKMENINEELQDAVANISHSRTMVVVAVQEGGFTTANSEIEQDRNVVMASDGGSGVVIDMPMASLKTARRTRRKKAKTVSEKVVNPTTPKLQKFTADQLTGMGMTEKEILVNILEQSKKKSGRKRKYASLETGIDEASDTPTDSMESGVNDANDCLTGSVGDIDTGVADATTDSVGTEQESENETNLVVCSATVTPSQTEDASSITQVDAIEGDLNRILNNEDSNVIGSDKSDTDTLINDIDFLLPESSGATHCTRTEPSKQVAVQIDPCASCSDNNEKTDLKPEPESTQSETVHEVAKFEEIQTRSKRIGQEKSHKTVQGNSKQHKQIPENPVPDTEHEKCLPTCRRNHSQQTSTATSQVTMSENHDITDKVSKPPQQPSKVIRKTRKPKPIGSKSTYHVMTGDTKTKNSLASLTNKSSNLDEIHFDSKQKKKAASKLVTKESTESNIESSENADGKVEVDDNMERRFSETELYRLFHYDDRSVVRLAPVLVDIVRDNDFVVEVDIADGLEVGQLDKKSLSDGLTRYSFCVSKCKDRELLTDERSSDAKHSRHSRKSSVGNTGSDRVESSEVMPSKTEDEEIEKKSENKSRRGRKPKVNKRSKVVKSDTLNSNRNVETDNGKGNVGDSHTEAVLFNCDGTEVSDADNDAETIQNTNLVINDVELKMEDSNTCNIDESDMSAVGVSECTSSSVNSDADQVEVKKGKGGRGRYKSKKADKVNCKNYTIRVNESGVREYGCPFCVYVSKYSSNANLHVQEHTEEKNIMCEECGTCWKSKARLQRHMVVHQRDRPFSCPLCHLTFKSKPTMKEHVRRHLGKKEFVCEHCSKSFVTKGDLNKHQRGHMGVQPYQCGECSKPFNDISSLYRHLREIHTQTHSRFVLCP